MGFCVIIECFRFSHRTSATTSEVIFIPMRMRESVAPRSLPNLATGVGGNFHEFPSS